MEEIKDCHYCNWCVCSDANDEKSAYDLFNKIVAKMLNTQSDLKNELKTDDFTIDFDEIPYANDENGSEVTDKFADNLNILN